MSEIPYGYVMPPASTPMPAQVPVPKGKFFFTPSVATDFDAIPHEKLREIIDSTDGDKVADVAKRLLAAAHKIKVVGDDIKKYMDEDHVPWRGEGGTAFREWGDKMAKATLSLAHYSETASTWMSHAATTMKEVKAGMPHVPGDAKKVMAAYAKANPPGQLTLDVKNGPTLKEVSAARTLLDKEHVEAARLMRKLAGSYIASQMNMQAATEPSFPPLPSAVMPPTKSKANIEGLRHDPSTGGTGGRSGGHGRQSPVSTDSASTGSPHGHSFSATTGPHHPMEHVGTEITSVPTATHDAAVPRAGETVSPPGGMRVGPTAPQPGPFVPPINPVQPGAPRTPGGRQTTAADRVSRVSGKGGFSELPGTRSPRIPADGVVGGRPSPAPKGGPASRIPRGTVVGNEPIPGGGTVQGRPAMGRPFGPTGASGSVGGPSGGAGGRRLAPGAEGGIVGGSPQRRPGGTTGGTFTSGGSGLVRGGTAGAEGAASGRGSAVAPPGSQARKNNPRRERGGERPDYLVEDEETWKSGHGHVAPPVIE